MSNLTATRLALFGKPARAPRAAKPYDHMSKAEMFARIEMLERRLARARTLASRFAADAHNAHDYATRDNFHAVESPCDLSTKETP